MARWNPSGPPPRVRPDPPDPSARPSRRDFRAEGEVEGGTAVDGALCPGAAAVAFDDPLDADQAGACAGKFDGGVQSLEGLEQLVHIGRIEAYAVVAHITADRRLIVGGGGELDAGVVAPGGELPGILDQVLEQGADETTVRGRPDAALDGEADLAAGLAGSQFTGDRNYLPAEIDRYQVQVGARHLRQAQQIVDDGSHPHARRLDPCGVAAA